MFYSAQFQCFILGLLDEFELQGKGISLTGLSLFIICYGNYFRHLACRQLNQEKAETLIAMYDEDYLLPISECEIFYLLFD